MIDRQVVTGVPLTSPRCIIIQQMHPMMKCRCILTLHDITPFPDARAQSAQADSAIRQRCGETFNVCLWSNNKRRVPAESISKTVMSYFSFFNFLLFQKTSLFLDIVLSASSISHYQDLNENNSQVDAVPK